MQPIIIIVKDNQEVAATFAEWLKSWLTDRPAATIALSGGSTPKALFQILAGEYYRLIDWSGVQLFWGDERCVPPDNEESNYGMTRDLLLNHIDIPEENIHRIRGEADPAAEAERYAKLLKDKLPEVGGQPVFDLVILGMGADGHTASIFPDQMKWLASDQVCAVARHPESGQKRITITGKVINRANAIVFLVTGESKKAKVREILRKEGNWRDYPAAHIDPVEGTLSWYLDEAAAAGL